MVDNLAVRAVGQNYLYFLQVAQGMDDNHGSREAFEAQAQREREHLLGLLHEVDRGIYTTLKALATEVGEYGETTRAKGLEAEANRLDGLESDLHSYLDGRKPNGVSPEAKAKEELIALATRARVSVAARRALGSEPRKSYDGTVVQELVRRKVAKEPRHAINLLNLSRGLAEGWSNDELVYWATRYRQARDNGAKREQAVAVANKALTVG